MIFTQNMTSTKESNYPLLHSVKITTDFDNPAPFVVYCYVSGSNRLGVTF